MDRYMYKETGKILAIVKPEGKVSFHTERGFQASAPIDIMTQDATVMMLKEQGFEDVTGRMI